MTAERVRVPKQEATEGQKVGYVGDVEIYEQKPGWSNAAPDRVAAERKVAEAKRELDEANADLGHRRQLQDESSARSEKRKGQNP
jgi:hypothetical protein